jgi:hypothetical protein
MARIVLIHGIGKENESADLLEADWIPALAGGVRNAGYAELADSIWRYRGGPGTIETRMAYYGNIFSRSGTEGSAPDVLSAEQAVVAQALALEWLERAALRSTQATERKAAAARLAFVSPETSRPSQRVAAVARPAILALAHVNWIAQVGAPSAERFVASALTQVTRYLTEDATRTAIRRSVLEVLGPDTRAVIAHSLGSVVAYEAVQTLAHPLPLLVTLGSPLGLDAIVLHRLQPSASFPSQVSRWVNIADPEDIVAAEPDLTSLFSSGKPAPSCLECHSTETGSDPHSPRFYLSKTAVGSALADVLMEDKADKFRPNECTNSMRAIV